MSYQGEADVTHELKKFSDIINTINNNTIKRI